MYWLDIVFYSLAAVSLLIALLLSSSGSTNGIVSTSGSDIEIFKKVKDRGIVKILQMILFILVFVLITIGIILRVLNIGN